MYDIAGKVVLITGAGSGIGREVAIAFAGEDTKLVLCDKNPKGLTETAEQILKNKSIPIKTITMDVTKEKEVASAAKEALEEFNHIDVLANCAGVSTMQWSWELTEEEWDFNMDVNAKGCWLVCKHIIPGMIARKQGKIINIASMGGKQGAILLSHYCASKFAVIGLTESIAKELAPYGITVNAVCPGYVKTPMEDREIQWEAKLRGIDDPEKVREEYVTLTPLARLSVPSDISKTMLFLASSQADFITAESIKVSGGQL